jgi:hypothetical protein
MLIYYIFNNIIISLNIFYYLKTDINYIYNLLYFGLILFFQNKEI